MLIDNVSVLGSILTPSLLHWTLDSARKTGTNGNCLLTELRRSQSTRDCVISSPSREKSLENDVSKLDVEKVEVYTFGEQEKYCLVSFISFYSIFTSVK